jgi:hypothetical protein
VLVHVKTTTVRQVKRTYRYLSLVESWGEDGKMRHRTVARLGEASALAASGQLGRIIAALSAFARRPWVDAESTADVVRHYRTLVQVERRFRVMKDFLAARRVYHPTEDRVRATSRFASSP